MTRGVVPPPVVEVVAAEVVAARIAATDRELAALDAELVALRADADALEAEGEPFDPETHAFVAIRLQRFLEDLRTEANAEIDALRSVAEARVRRHRPEVSFSHLVTRVDTPVVVPSPSVPSSPVADPASVPASEPTPVPAMVPAMVSPPDLETEFWSAADAPAAHRTALRTVRAVGLQAMAIVLVLAVVLIRIG